MLNLINTAADHVSRKVVIRDGIFYLYINDQEVLSGEIPTAYTWLNKKQEPNRIVFYLKKMGNNSCGVECRAEFENSWPREAKKYVIMGEPTPRPFSGKMPENQPNDWRFITGSLNTYVFGQNTFDRPQGEDGGDLFELKENRPLKKCFGMPLAKPVRHYYQAKKGYLTIHLPSPFREDYEWEAISSVKSASSMADLAEKAGQAFKARILSLFVEDWDKRPFLEAVHKDAFTWYIWRRSEYDLANWARQLRLADAPPPNSETFYEFPYEVV